MIKKEYLRYGNYVMDRGDKLLVIDYFERDKICMEVRLPFGQIGHPYTEYFDYLKPVPITVDFLEKNATKISGTQNAVNFSIFLTEWSSDNFNRQRIDFFGQLDDKANGEVELNRDSVCFARLPCKYVHELQNLYFAITGHEMEIKL